MDKTQRLILLLKILRGMLDVMILEIELVERNRHDKGESEDGIQGYL